FSSGFFKNKEQEQLWTQQQKELLLESKTTEVIENIIRLSGPKNKAAEKLIAYYRSNLHRMGYKKYLQIGNGLIGSGAIESAHRTVIQKRMKQSGQRWSTGGARNMLNLRVVRKNKQWNKIIALTKTDLKKAA
ncbi:MAG: hypothetical protein HYX40_10700, partial [Sphingobacteriales bacterium]|nr:hypothetical protein [Sphingobacteriales bacterium]